MESISTAQMICSDQEEQEDLRRGPWTVEEDRTLINYIHKHGEGHWNSLARLAGLKRTGKSCRLRWLNYLHPNVRRGNITLEEQLLILELHSSWGNRWSKIAQHLPGRTDNEIKNYWRTRVQKHAKQLKCDVNSQQFKDTVRYLWMPRLVERIQAAAAATTTESGVSPDTTAATYNQAFNNNFACAPSYTSENSSTAASSESFATQVSSCSVPIMENPNLDCSDYYQGRDQIGYGDSYYNLEYGSGFLGMDESSNLPWLDSGEETSDSLWNVDDIWLL